MDKKWIIGIVSSVIIVPAIAFQWKHIQDVYATPEKVATVEKKVVKTETTQEQLTKLVAEQNERLKDYEARQDKADAINELQVQAMKEQLTLVAELKKKK